MFKDPIDLTPGTKKLMELLESKERDQDVPQGKRKKATQGYGHKHTEETRKKIAEKLRQRPRTDETINQRIREFRREGLTAKEMSERLNITVRSVQCRIYRMDNHLVTRTRGKKVTS